MQKISLEWYTILFLLFLLPCCLNTKQEKPNEKEVIKETLIEEVVAETKIPEQELVYDLDTSAAIIISLLKKNELKEILAESEQDEEKIDTLIKNFSPAQMAFEAEILNYKDPVVLLFYTPGDAAILKLEKKLEELAKKYQEKFKFVKINSEKLFKLTQEAEVDVLPTVMIMHNRQEVARIEKPNIETLEMLIMET